MGLLDFDGDGFCERLAEEGEFGRAADANLIGALEGKALGEGEGDAGTDALCGEVAEHLRIFIGDAGYLCGLAGMELRKSLMLWAGEGAVESGDGVAVGVE